MQRLYSPFVKVIVLAPKQRGKSRPRRQPTGQRQTLVGRSSKERDRGTTYSSYACSLRDRQPKRLEKTPAGRKKNDWKTATHCTTYLQRGRGEQAHRRRGSALLLVLERHRRGKVELVQHSEGVTPRVRVGEDLSRTRPGDSAQPRGPLEKKLLKHKVRENEMRPSKFISLQ